MFYLDGIETGLSSGLEMDPIQIRISKIRIQMNQIRIQTYQKDSIFEAFWIQILPMRIWIGSISRPEDNPVSIPSDKTSLELKTFINLQRFYFMSTTGVFPD